jgi:hypothetical protein
MPVGRGYVGIFSSGGKLVAYTDTPKLVREVAGKVEADLPRQAPDRESGILLDARRRALRTIADEGCRE